MVSFKHWKLHSMIHEGYPIKVKLPYCDIDMLPCTVYPNNCAPNKCAKHKLQLEKEKLEEEVKN